MSRRGATCLVWATAMSAIMCLVVDGSVAAAAEPKLIGRGSCGSATCHGGLTDRGPAWHRSDSVWLSKDPHVGAGTVLLKDLSKRIAIALEPQATDPEVFERVLIERCASCHAPSLAPVSGQPAFVPQVARDASDMLAVHAVLRRKLAGGVSCEACHGPASEWLSSHTLASWSQKGSERFTPQYGMKDTETLAARTQNCAGCHIGSRTQDGLVRDMNHDMIAAGHPALHFDMWQAQQHLPAHWDTAQERLAAVTPQTAPAVYAELRRHVLGAAKRLSEERIAYSKSSLQTQDFVPELSEFDCAACHHVLAVNSPRSLRGSTGQTLWHPWYTAGQLAPELRRSLHMNASDFEDRLKRLDQQLATDNPQAASSDSLGRVRQLIASNPFEPAVDYSGLPVWLDELEALVRKADTLPASARERMQQVMAESREKLVAPESPLRANELRANASSANASSANASSANAASANAAPANAAPANAAPANAAPKPVSERPYQIWDLPLSRLMPAPWDVRSAEQTRRQLQEIIAQSTNGAQQ